MSNSDKTLNLFLYSQSFDTVLSVVILCFELGKYSLQARVGKQRALINVL